MVDGISLHAYYGNTQPLTGNSAARYLAMNLDMDRQIREIAAVCDYVQGLRKSSKRLWLSFDEWNVWYRARSGDAVNGRRQFAPKLLEEVYNLEDALLVGGFVNTLLRNSDRVRVGCLAQLVNVIAPLVTNDTGVLRQSTYYPVRLGAALRARPGAGSARRVRDLSDSRCRPAGRLRAQRPGAVRRRGRHARRANGQACVLMLNRDSRASASWRWTGATSRRRASWRARRSPARTSRRSTRSSSRGGWRPSGSMRRPPARA